MEEKKILNPPKKVLIITYYWPPSGGAGVQRWLKFSKYLPDFGWQPIIYTPENPYFQLKDYSLLKDVHPSIRVIKRKIWEPYKLASLFFGTKKEKINTGNLDHAEKRTSWTKKIFNNVRANWIIPDPRKFWVKPSVKFLKKLIREENIKIVISTGPPHSMHLIGYSLKKNIPDLKWVADFRDPWSQLDFYDSLPISEKSLNHHKKLEKKVLELADIVLATSPSMYKQLEPFDYNKYHFITNGYDPDDFTDQIKKEKSSQKITITHAGLLKSERNPENLWKALSKWISKYSDTSSPDLSLICAGYVDSSIEERLSKDSEIGKILDLPGYLERTELQEIYNKTDVFLLLVNNTHNSSVNIPGKLFEYIATGKKILVVCKKTDDVSTLLQTYPNATIFDYNDSPDTYYSKLKTIFSGEIAPASAEFIEKFNRKNTTKQLSSILDALYKQKA